MPRINNLDTDVKTVVSFLELPPEELPGKTQIIDENDQKIIRFYSKYRFWMLNFAKLLVESIDENVRINSGFAVLNILNAYVDTVGKLCGTSEVFENWDNQTGGEPSPKLRIKIGLEFVFPEIINSTDKKQVTDTFYSNYRNGIAHAGFPNRVFLTHEGEFPLAWGDFRGNFILIINHCLLYQHIHQHFDEYVLRLRNPTNQDDFLMRELFLKRVDKIR